MEFATKKTQFEDAVDFVLSKQIEKTTYPEIYKLPKSYKHLSAGGGEVIVINNNAKKGVFFYTFRGTPDGRIGFLKIKEDNNINDYTKELFNEINEINKIGDNWYFISGE